METLPLWLLVVLVLAAVGVGLWVGHRAGQLVPSEEEGSKKSLTTRARELGTRGIVSLWKWNRARKKKSDERRR